MKKVEEVKANLVSLSPNGRKAEVVVHLGESANRRSFTRHLKKDGGVWTGLEPDPKVLAEKRADHKAAREAVDKVEFLYRNALAYHGQLLRRAKEKIESAEEPVSGEEIESSEAVVSTAEAALEEAKEHQASLPPIHVPFVF